MLFVTHDRREAVELASRIVVLDGAPVRVVRDMPINLTPEERATPACLDAVRHSLDEA